MGRGEEREEGRGGDQPSGDRQTEEKDGLWMMEGAADGTDDEPRPSKKSLKSVSHSFILTPAVCSRESTFRLQFIIFMFL